jgi:heat shock protein HslJ
MGAAYAPSVEGQPWVLVSGVSVPQDVAVVWPSALLENGTIGGTTGCNRYIAHYTIDDDSVEIGPIALTRMACPPPADAIERAYVAALEQVTGWRVDGEDLVLTGAEEAELLRYARATPLGNWRVTGLVRGDALASPLVGTELTARFAVDGTLSGSAGCNTYAGSYSVEKSAIEIATRGVTRRACADPAGVMDQETAYLSLLPTAVGYRLDGRSLELLAVDETRIATYTRTTAR